MAEKRDKRIRFLPTPDEIRRGCRDIQKSWTRRERELRERWSDCPWIPFTLTNGDLAELFDDKDIDRISWGE